jgi:two-component system, chemotaxis family, chemotaxis protein CheV
MQKSDMRIQAQALDDVGARTSLAGSNKMEVLLFSLGSSEVFGINVFKVREVTATPIITRTPNMPFGVEGVISLRGSIIPVIDLVSFIKIGEGACSRGTMIVTEFSRHTQGFLVHEVDRIIRVNWDRVKPPENMVSDNEDLITALTELDDGRLVSILDVEQILADVIGEPQVPNLPVQDDGDGMVFFVDDSAVARREIVGVLDKMGVKHMHATNGLEAWERLKAMANRAQGEDVPLSGQLKLILADAEMPEMDGYVLTRNIKSDTRFAGIPVVMHSSLSSEANRVMGQQVGVDSYVAKFDSAVLADTMLAFLRR